VTDYTNYKQTGHLSLQEVPSHWTLTTIGAITTRRSARNRTDLPLLSVLREKGVVLRSSLGDDENHNFIPDDLSNYRVAAAGDLVINKMKAWQGSVGIAPCEGIVSPAYFVFELLNITPPFAHRLFRSTPYVAFFAQSSDGVRIGQWDLSIDRMKRIPVPLPPPAEQSAIVRFLAALDRRVNQFVRAKRRLIELLTEQKQALITHAVTRGLNPNAKRKPSGIDWLGDVPEHWELVPNRAMFGLRKQLVGAAAAEHTLLSLTKRGVIARDMENPEGKFPASFDTYQVIEPGDYVFCLFDIDETPRAVGLSSLHGMITGAYTRFACKQPEYAQFIYRYYLAMDFDKRLKPLYTGLRKVITKGTFLGAKMPRPPVEEALAIVKHIDQQSEAIDAIVARAEREIALVREYRTRLAAEVVTGKLDVRSAADRLPTDEEDTPDQEQFVSESDESDENLLEVANGDADEAE